jgi:hypothetical protein
VRLIGRDTELQAMTAGLDDLTRRRGQTFVVVGDRGVGKTALVDAVCAPVDRATTRVLWMAGRALAVTAPGWPWTAVAQEIDAPELVERLDACDTSPRVFEAVAAALAAATDHQPIVLVIDDADALHDAAADLLVFVSEQLRARPLLIVATARGRTRVERLIRSATLVVLQGLGGAAVAALLERHGVAAPDATADAVRRLTGGLPDEVAAIARELASGPERPSVDDAVRAALRVAADVANRDGRAAVEPLVRRLTDANDLAAPSTAGAVALFVHRLGGTTSTTADDRVAQIEAALAALDDDATALALRAELHAALALELYHGDVLHAGPDPRGETDRAWALAEQSGDRIARASARRARHDVEWRAGNAGQRLVDADEMVALLDGTGRYDDLSDAVLTRVALYLELGDARAERELDRFFQVAARAASPRVRHLALSRGAMRALMIGELDRAEQLIDEALAAARASGEPDGAVVALNQRFELAGERGDRSPMLPRLERFRAVSSHPAIAASLSLARIDAGDDDGARAAIATYRDVALDALQPEYGRAWVLSMLGEAFVALGEAAAVEHTITALAPLAGTNVVVGGAVLYRGSVEHHLGVLFAAAGDRDTAAEHLRAAATVHERLGAACWARRTRDALDALDALDTPARAPFTTERDAAASMIREGDVWTISFGARTARAKDSKGLRDLATLVANPGVDITSEQLAGRAPAATTPDEVLDARARDEVARRLRALDAEVARADARGDPTASERAIAERDALVAELSRATGLGSRSRRLGDPAERARKAVSARIHDAITRLEQQHAELGVHLRESVVTGRSCRYAPRAAVTWVVRQKESGR